MLRRIAVGLTMLLLAAAPAAAQSVVGSPHDFSFSVPGGQVCVFCHTPHQSAAAGAQDPLWNHTVSSTASYGVYGSDTLDADMTGADIGGQPAGSQSASALCMSCHDGTVAIESLYNPPNTGAPTPQGTMDNFNPNANLGTQLSDDHPVNFIYDAALATTDGELVTPVSASWVDAGNTVPLFGGSVQCASCHDPHNNQFGAFLVVSNNQSALCTTCHIK